MNRAGTRQVCLVNGPRVKPPGQGDGVVVADLSHSSVFCSTGEGLAGRSGFAGMSSSLEAKASAR